MKNLKWLLGKEEKSTQKYVFSHVINQKFNLLEFRI